MKISIRSHRIEKVKGRYRRYIKWRLYRLGRKFGKLSYARLFVRREGGDEGEYLVTLKLQIQSKWVVIKRKGQDLVGLTDALLRGAQRQLAELHR